VDVAGREALREGNAPEGDRATDTTKVWQGPVALVAKVAFRKAALLV
jgi:hypothetical protein